MKKLSLFVLFLVIIILSFVDRLILHKLPPNIATAVVFILSFVILCILLKNKSKHTFERVFNEFVLPFYQSSIHFHRTFFLVILLLFVPILIILFNTLDLKIFKQHFDIYGVIDPKLFWSFWLSILSIFITSRVYFEIKQHGKHNLEEFLINISNFLDASRTTDEIRFILPSLFLGKLSKKHFHEKFLSRIIKTAESNNIKISFLDYDNRISDFIAKFKKDNENEKGEAKKKEKKDDKKNLMILDFMDHDNSPLKNFHYKWYPSKEKTEQEKRDYFLKLYEFIDKLHKINQEKESKILYPVIKNYFIENHKVGEGNQDIFLFSNISQGKYYYGKVYITKQTDIEFHATVFDSERLRDVFESIFDSFVKNRC